MSELWPLKDWYEMTTFWRVIGPGKCLPYFSPIWNNRRRRRRNCDNKGTGYFNPGTVFTTTAFCLYAPNYDNRGTTILLHESPIMKTEALYISYGPTNCDIRVTMLFHNKLPITITEVLRHFLSEDSI